MAERTRAVGFCTSEGCTEFRRGLFLLDHGGKRFECECCGQPGLVEPEVGAASEGQGEFKEVRVEYGFDPLARSYSCVAVVRDESLSVGRSYLLKSPLVFSRARALAVAEAVLGNLNTYGAADGRELAKASHKVLRMDDEDFYAKLRALADAWRRA